MSAKEFRKQYNYTGGFVDARKRNNNQDTRKTSTLCADNSETEIHKQAIQTLSNLSNYCKTDFFNSPVALHVKCYSGSNADADNILKGIIDSLQGYAFKNDKQVRETAIRIYASENK